MQETNLKFTFNDIEGNIYLSKKHSKDTKTCTWSSANLPLSTLFAYSTR